MNHLLLLAVMLSAMPRVVLCYVQDNCPPCDQDKVANGYGDAEILLLYQKPATYPPQVTGTPAYHDVESDQWAIGRRTLAQLKELGRTKKPEAAPTKQGRWEQRDVWVQKGRKLYRHRQWQWVEN